MSILQKIIKKIYIYNDHSFLMGIFKKIWYLNLDTKVYISIE